MSRDTIRVIIFKEDGKWIAQGLEHDICVQANNLEDLYGRFEVAVRLESEDGLDRIGKAPQHFFKLWERKSGDFHPSASADRSYTFGIAA